jgi:hypothetical protein
VQFGSGMKKDREMAFLVDHEDALADELGAEFVETVTSGGADHGVELRDTFFDEEIGGPFVTSTAGQEFADGVDASNPRRSRREPFPKT